MHGYHSGLWSLSLDEDLPDSLPFPLSLLSFLSPLPFLPPLLPLFLVDVDLLAECEAAFVESIFMIVLAGKAERDN
jgi:hypothetical protein